MVTDRELRRIGIGARNPAVRRMLALTLQDCSTDAVEWILQRAVAELGAGEPAAAAATRTLQDGTWRELWAAELVRRQVATTDAMPSDRLEGLVACRVIADRQSVDQVARELGIDRDEVCRLVIRAGVARGMSDERIAVAIGTRSPRPMPRRPAAEQTTRPRIEPASDPTRPPAAVERAPRPTRAQILKLYSDAGRRPPAHVLEKLTAAEGTA